MFEKQFHLDSEYLDKLFQKRYYWYFLSEEFLKCMQFIADWLDSISPSLSVLEMGSGESPLLQKLGFTHPYIGVEWSKDVVSECQRRWINRLNTEFIYADIEHFFNAANKTADVLYDGNIMYYVRKDRVLPFILKAAKQIGASYFITCEVEKFRLPNSSSLKLITFKEFYLDLPTLSEFKRNRRIEIYQCVQG